MRKYEINVNIDRLILQRVVRLSLQLLGISLPANVPVRQ